MTILVTGGAGFIGSNFVLDWFKSNDEEVINLDKLTYAGNLKNLGMVGNNNYQFIEGDIKNSYLIDGLLKKYKPRAVINFAAETHVDRSIDSSEIFVQTNILGTYHLLESSRKYWEGLHEEDRERFRFLHISTDEVYGALNVNDLAFKESNPYKPNSPYSASKAAADHLVRSYFHTYGMPVLTTNCSNNYGPRQYPEKLIPLCIQKAINNEDIPVYGQGLQIRDWLYVSDHCKAIMLVLEQGNLGETYNVGGQNELSNIELVKSLCKLLDELAPKGSGISYQDQITFVQDRPGHDFRYAIDTGKINEQLGWLPIETFVSGLRKTVDWYLGS